MDLSNFTSPVEAVQVLSIVHCVNALSDILFTKNFLTEADKNQPIPVNNALKYYLSDTSGTEQLELHEKKLYLAQKLMSDNYQCVAKGNGVFDPNFVDIISNRIITTFQTNASESSTQRKVEPNLLQLLVPPNSVKDDVVNEKNPRVRRSLVSRFIRSKIISQAINYALKQKKLPEVKIRNVLESYDFPPESGRNQINFVKEWMSNEGLKIPTWAEQYKINEFDMLFYQLKYKETMDNPNMKIEEARKRIKAIYSMQEYASIEKVLPLDEVFKYFKRIEAYNHARFEDYYALRYYGDKGYLLMDQDLHVSRRMKNAIYRLAIRQSEDPSETHGKSFFRGEARIPTDIEKEIQIGLTAGFQFNRFTSISTALSTSIEYSKKGRAEFTRVLYKMTIPNPIIRARVEHLLVKDEKETILLPGTKFHIDKLDRSIEVTATGAKQHVVKIEMTHMDNVAPKMERQKESMVEIKKLLATGTRFYAEDIPNWKP